MPVLTKPDDSSSGKQSSVVNENRPLVRVLPKHEILRIASTLPIRTSCRLNWPGVEVHHYKWSQHLQHQSREYSLPQLAVFIPHLSKPAKGEVVVAGKRMTARLENGCVSIAPPGLMITSRFEGAPHETTVIFIDPLIVADVGANEDGVMSLEIVPQYNVRDPLIVQIGAALDVELASPNPSPRIYAGSLAVALTAHILSRYANPASIRLGGPSLSSVQLRRSVEFMRQNLSQNLTLQELASVANMSKYHFAKSFRQAMGIAPHHYLMGLRIAKARDLLDRGNLPIKDIASRVGYADRSHFAAQFLRIVGTTPARYRRTQPLESPADVVA